MIDHVRPAADAAPVHVLLTSTDVLDAVPDGILVVNRDGTILAVNREMLRLTGYSATELTGASVEVLVAPEHRVRHRIQVRRFARNPTPRPMGVGLTVDCRRRDGSSFPAEVSLNPVGSPEYVVVAVRDVSKVRSALHAAERQRRLQAISALGASLMEASDDIAAAFTVLAAALRDSEGFARVEIVVSWPDGRSARGRSDAVDGIEHLPRTDRWRADIPVAAPLVGWIDVWPAAETPITEDDADALRSLGGVVAQAADRATHTWIQERTERALRRQVERQAILIELNRQTLGAPTFNLLALNATRAVAEHLDLDHVAVLEHLADEKQFLVRAEFPPSAQLGDRFPASPANQAGYTLLAGDSVLVLDLERETRFPASGFLLRQGLHSGGSAAIPGREGPWGVICGHARRTGAITQEDLLFLEAVGTLLGAYAEHCRMDEDLRSSDGLSLSVLESLTGPAALLDAHGRITAANQAWDQFMLKVPPSWRGDVTSATDPAALLRRARDQGAPGVEEILRGLQSVLAGNEGLVRVEFAMPGQPESWFAARIARRVDPRGGAIILLVDISEQKRLVRDLEHLALHDGLTDLPNRGLLFDRLDRALARRSAIAGTVGVFFIDLDRFKTFNDSHGHTRGDELLVAVADRLRAVAEPTDTVARLGGDEFVIVREGVGDPDDARHFADEILHSFATPFVLGDNHSVTMTASIGIALARAYSDADSLLRDSDLAMYRAKERGRARAEFFDHAAGVAVVERYATEDELRVAIPNAELRIRYQPIVELESQRLLGVEALVRWNHPTRGLLAPADFLGIAYETGLVVPIGNWVLREACHFARALTDGMGGPTASGSGADRPSPTVAVNICPQQLAQPGFVEMVREVLAEAGLDPYQLVLELTESVLFETDPSTAATLDELGDLGIRVAIDDFGTGYASLQYLKRFPIAGLKIDRCFVDGVADDPNDAAIVAAIIGIARNMGVYVVAEGIESHDQQARLQELGCRHGQGFLYGEPEPAETALARFSTLGR
jgi:diguanylate cyclase (GGDEF)-like protein/PAS domain S-box-containing protein